MSRTCKENAKNMPRKCQENAKKRNEIHGKCNNKQHKYPVPAKHKKSLEIYGIIGKLWDMYRNAKKNPNNTKQLGRKCEGNA
jgi:hypothetical protein